MLSLEELGSISLPKKYSSQIDSSWDIWDLLTLLKASQIKIDIYKLPLVIIIDLQTLGIPSCEIDPSHESYAYVLFWNIQLHLLLGNKLWSS